MAVLDTITHYRALEKGEEIISICKKIAIESELDRLTDSRKGKEEVVAEVEVVEGERGEGGSKNLERLSSCRHLCTSPR